jgi:DNA-binding NarL/FixJ family response regulator
MSSAQLKTALIVEPDESHRLRFATALNKSENFVKVSATVNIEEGKYLLHSETLFTHIFLSSDLPDRHMTEFIASTKSLNPPPKFSLVAMRDSEVRRKIIEKGTVINADAIIFGPHTNESVHAVIDSLDQTDKPLGPLSPITLLIAEIIKELDTVTETLNPSERSDYGFKMFGERLTVLKQFSQIDLEKYLAMALDVFINTTTAPPPNPNKPKRSYNGASKRVKQMVDEINSRS